VADRNAGTRPIVLDPRWFVCTGRDAGDFALSSAMDRLSKRFPDYVLPVSTRPLKQGWILKGDLYHRPDAVLEGEGPAEVADPHGCGSVYQPRLSMVTTVLVMGYRSNAARCALGAVRMHSEAFAREDFLIAGESTEATWIEEKSRRVLDVLDHVGYFS